MQLYVWHPVGIARDHARRKLGATLDARAAELGAAYGHEFRTRVVTTDFAVVGTIDHGPDLPGSATFDGDETAGAVCVGAPELEPSAAANGHVDGAGLRRALLDEGDAHAIAVPGRWAAAAWDERRLLVVNSPANGLGLWYVEGPHGWSVGSSGRVVVQLVGRTPEVDLDAAAMTVTLGFVTSRSLFAGVRRFGSGLRARINANGPVVIDRPVGLAHLLGEREGLDYDEAVGRFAGRITTLVDGEISQSRNPLIQLSGGRDSRLVAAAAVAAGHVLPASTGGPAASRDVRVAREVARRLGLPHTAMADPKRGETPEQREVRLRTGGGGRAVPMTADRLSAWVRLSDGTAPITLAWVTKDLSTGRPPSSEPARQVFNGLGGTPHKRSMIALRGRDLDRPGTGGRGRGLVIDALAGGPGLRRPVRELIVAEIDSLDGLEDTSVSLSEWLIRCYIRLRENNRGMDTLARTDLDGWSWAPLMDPRLIGISREAPSTARVSMRFVADVAARLAPQLAGLEYDRPAKDPRPEWLLQLVARLRLRGPARRARAFVNGRRAARRPAEQLAGFRALWNEVFLGPGDHVWPELVDEMVLRRWIRDEPDGKVLTRLANPELLLRP